MSTRCKLAFAKRRRSRRSREHSSSVVRPRLISVRVVLQDWVRRDRAGLQKPPTRAVDFVWSVRRVVLGLAADSRDRSRSPVDNLAFPAGFNKRFRGVPCGFGALPPAFKEP
jgi:hypothetical protein